MMKLDLEKLEQLAKAATPGRWPNFNDADIREQLWRHYDWDKKRESRSPICIPYSDAEYIAAANPETMLALIERIKKLEAVAKAGRRVCWDMPEGALRHAGEIAVSPGLLFDLRKSLMACEGGSDG